MIPEKKTRLPSSWQATLRQAVRTFDELARLLDIPVDRLTAGLGAAAQFPLLIPRGYIDRMQRGDIGDPLLRQVLPVARELANAGDYSDDPLDEARFADSGVVRKYASRALLITTEACPVHCRYCFRRAFPYSEHNAGRGDFDAAIRSLAQSPEITEVILSGGDPLALADRRLERLFARIAGETQIGTVRLHTRFPIMIPERITAKLSDLLAATRLRTVVVVHANHPNEIDDGVAAALNRLKQSVTAVLNQSVLLAGVNDDAGVLGRLSHRLFAAGVLPYYLHALDPVTGSGHFHVDDASAVRLVGELRAGLPGYLVPRLVREVPGAFSKTPLV